MIKLKAGEYYIGDCCYVFGDREDNVWGDFCDKLGDDEAPIKVLGHDVVAYSTLYGDGCYPSNAGLFEFPVDSGLIGCTPKELWIEDGEPSGCLLVRFDSDFTCENDFVGKRGVLRFGHIIIDTRDEEDEEEWW